MLAGPLDYTPGAMSHRNPTDWSPCFDRPCGLGTRCQQLAMFVMYEAPLQMIADSPSAYLKEPRVLDFLSKVATVWDETVALAGSIREYALIARRAQNTWFIGGLSNNEQRTITLDLSFLEANRTWLLHAYEDGVNAEQVGEDYRYSVFANHRR